MNPSELSWTQRCARQWDRILASDPGLARLRTAAAGALSMASALGVELLVFGAVGASPQTLMVSMLLGAVVSMMGSMALTGSDAWLKVRTAVFFPVAVGIGMSAAALVSTHQMVLLAGFIVIMFVAVFVRRFGVAFFFYGFMCWMGYFFTSFLRATPAMLPTMLVAAVIGAAWVLLLSLTVFGTNAPRALRRTIRAFDTTSRTIARTAADLLAGSDDTTRTSRRLLAQRARLSEVALLVEARSAERSAMPTAWSGPILRRRMLDAHQAVDGFASAAATLARSGSPLASDAEAVLRRLALRDDPGAITAARDLMSATESADRDTDGWWPARHVAAAALEFVAAITTARLPSYDPDDADIEIDEFEPVVSLAAGNLPGSGSVAKEVPARGGRWNPLARLDMNTRQAFQVAIAGVLAIVVGQQLSPTRYYWAVIAAFIMFTGAATRAETFLKGFNRVLGTLIGLLAAIWLAGMTAGHTYWALALIVVSMFCGFYLMQRSYVYMIFFVTIMIGQMYVVLHQFSDELLVLRLEETAVGAVVGFVVAMVFLPLSTRDTVHSARTNLLTGIGGLLDTAGHRLAGTTPDTEEPPATLDAQARALDDLVRQLSLVAKPLTRPLLWGNSPAQTRHRLALYAAIGSHARGLAVALLHEESTSRHDGLATVCHILAEAVNRMAAEPPGRRSADVIEALDRADTALFTENIDAFATAPARRALHHIHQSLRALAAPDESAPVRQAPANETPH